MSAACHDRHLIAPSQPDFRPVIFRRVSNAIRAHRNSEDSLKHLSAYRCHYAKDIGENRILL